ncbi:hypothetical protein D3C78_1337400 [compost metagenome]
MQHWIKVAQQLNELQSVHSRHTNIGNYKIRLVLIVFFQGFVTISCCIHNGITKSLPVNKYTKSFSQLRFVVNYKHFNQYDSPCRKKFEDNLKALKQALNRFQNSNRLFQRNSINNLSVYTIL